MFKKDKNLGDDQLGNVSGGYIFDSSGIIGANEKYNWEVLDEKGDVRGQFSSYEIALKEAKEMKYDTMVVDWDRVCELRGNK